MLPHDFFLDPRSGRLALALLHFVWQGLLIAALYAVAAAWLARRPQRRYAVGVVALAAMAACLPITYALVESPQTSVIIAAGEPGPRTSSLPQTQPLIQDRTEQNAIPEAAVEPALTIAADRASPVPIAAATELDRALGWRDELYRVVVLSWLLGVAVLSLRLLSGAVALRSLTKGNSPSDIDYLDILERLGRAMRLRRLPRLVISPRVAEAIATGLFRPVIVFPAAWLAELPPAVIEAVIAHELAHIRRYDLWINLLQRAIEALLFFHPAVWWVSRQVREDREMCCDELAVAATGRKVAYVSALEIVARRAARAPLFSLATGIGGRKMRLLQRVRHVLGLPARQQSGSWWAAGVLALAVPLGMWALSGPAAPVAQAQDDREDSDRGRERAERREREERAERAEREERRERAERVERRERERRGDRDARDDREERNERERPDDVRRGEDRRYRVELDFGRDEQARDKDRRAAEEFRRRVDEQRRQAEDQRRQAENAVPEAHAHMRNEMERARDELKKHMSEVQDKIAAEMKRAEESGQKDKVQALRQKMEEARRQVEKEARGMEEKFAEAMRRMDGDVKVKFSKAQGKAEQMREQAEKMQHELQEQQRHLQEKLEAANKQGDKAAIEKLHAAMEKMNAEAMAMQQKMMRSMDQQMDKGLIAKKQAIGERQGAGGPPEAQREMMQAIKELRNEVQQLRREVRELREQGGRAEKPKEKPKPKGEKVSGLDEIPYVGRLFKKEGSGDYAFPTPEVSIEFTDPKSEKPRLEPDDLKIQIELQNEELDKLQRDDPEKIKAIELELNSAASKALKEIELKSTADKASLNEQALKRLAEQAANDLDVRYAAKAADVAKAELGKVVEANRVTRGAVSEIEIERRKHLYDKAMLEIERAKRDQLDRISKLKTELQKLDKQPVDTDIQRSLDVHKVIKQELFGEKDKQSKDDKAEKNAADKTAVEIKEKPAEPAKP